MTETNGTAEARVSGIATASLVLGIASIVIGLFFAVGWVIGALAVTLGAVAQRQPIGNASTARTGVTLGIVGVLVTLVVAVLRVGLTH